MRRISTLFFAAILSAAGFKSFAQCGGIQYNFNDGTTQGFTGTGALGSSGSALKYSGINDGILTLNTPALMLPSGAGSIDFGFTYATGTRTTVTAITVSVNYVNTNGILVTGPAQSLSLSSPVCTSVPKPADMTTTGANTNSYQLVFNFSVTGNGSNGAATLTIDDYRTSSSAGQIVLPVKFSGFEAKSSSNNVSLTWNVGTEENVSGYAVQKSADGRNFADIAFVNASGSSSYRYTDTKAGAFAYYRIKSVDADGSYSYSTVVLVRGASAAVLLKAFPTPAVKELTIQHATATSGSLLTISAEDGRVVRSIVPAKGAQQTVVDLSSEKAGLYLVRYDEGNGNVETLKILKQ